MSTICHICCLEETSAGGRGDFDSGSGCPFQDSVRACCEMHNRFKLRSATVRAGWFSAKTVAARRSAWPAPMPSAYIHVAGEVTVQGVRKAIESMGLYDRGYYQDDMHRRTRWEAAQARTYVIPLIVINVAIFLLDAFSPVMEQGGHWLSNTMSMTSETMRQPWNWWKFLTYGFAHAPLDSKTGIMHVGGNMLTLFFLGRSVEVVLGSGRFLRLFLVSIVVGGVGWALINTLKGQPAIVCGASGAVSAVVAMFIMKFPRETLLLFGVVPIRAWILGVVIIAMDLMRSFTPGSQIAGEAHLFGAAFGAACVHWNWQLNWLDWSGPVAMMSGLFSRKTNLKVHDPDSRAGDADRLQEQADAILDKISREGEASLTRRERKILNRYSQQVRDRKQ